MYICLFIILEDSGIHIGDGARYTKMKYTLEIHPEVEDDALIAFNWYESKSIGLGEEFLRVFIVV